VKGGVGSSRHSFSEGARRESSKIELQKQNKIFPLREVLANPIVIPVTVCR